MPDISSAPRDQAARDRALHLCASHFAGIDLGFDRVYLRHEADDLADAELLQHLARNRAGRDAPDRPRALARPPPCQFGCRTSPRKCSQACDGR